MPKEVILTQQVAGLGIEGDVVTVADGYARNYLMPKKKAAPVTNSLRKQLTAVRAVRLSELEQSKTNAQKLSEKIAGMTLTIKVKTHDDGKLFGSVTSADIITAFDVQGVKVSKDQIRLDHPVKELGSFETKADLHPEVTPAFTVSVVGE